MDLRTSQLLQRLQASYQRGVATTRENVTGFAVARWESMESWRDADVQAFQAVVLPVVLSGQQQVAELTNAYITMAANTATGEAVRPAPLNVRATTGAAARNGTPPSEVYQRPQMTLNMALSNGATLTAAVKQSTVRLRSLVATDLQLAKTRTLARNGRSVRYRRVLTGAENCALCVIASTQRYRRGDLMPIHPGCDCSIVEEISDDPRQVIAPDLLEATRQAVLRDVDGTGQHLTDGHGKTIRLRNGSTDANDYRDLIITRDHGEYGPTLAWRGDDFTSPADLAA